MRQYLDHNDNGNCDNDYDHNVNFYGGKICHNTSNICKIKNAKITKPSYNENENSMEIRTSGNSTSSNNNNSTNDDINDSDDNKIVIIIIIISIIMIIMITVIKMLMTRITAIKMNRTKHLQQQTSTLITIIEITRKCN